MSSSVRPERAAAASSVTCAGLPPAASYSAASSAGSRSPTTALSADDVSPRVHGSRVTVFACGTPSILASTAASGVPVMASRWATTSRRPAGASAMSEARSSAAAGPRASASSTRSSTGVADATAARAATTGSTRSLLSRSAERRGAEAEVTDSCSAIAGMRAATSVVSVPRVVRTRSGGLALAHHRRASASGSARADPASATAPCSCVRVRESSATRRVLPVPAAPHRVTTAGYPDTARVHAERSSAWAAGRSTNGSRPVGSSIGGRATIAVAEESPEASSAQSKTTLGTASVNPLSANAPTDVARAARSWSTSPATVAVAST